ncbi:hypothetical protein [Pseudopontixanthobacter vadosimaris]|uniref:hypothetical protein n=1 Tax=Pseudopontixanthobacter vadosimaris TaxID=2726450 RepID=UPI0014758D63|nr:hypothetical protein [Pseudopontixanthobacter vadosimaris]
MELIAAPALIVIYRWRIATEDAEEFRRSWARATRELAPFGSLGSLLAVGQDGIYHATPSGPTAKRETRLLPK